MENKEISFDEYKRHIPAANKIYDALYGTPKTHQEYAEGFNIRGKIIRALI